MKDTFKDRKLSDENMKKVSGGNNGDITCPKNPKGDHHEFDSFDSASKCIYCGVEFGSLW